MGVIMELAKDLVTLRGSIKSLSGSTRKNSTSGVCCKRYRVWRMAAGAIRGSTDRPDKAPASPSGSVLPDSAHPLPCRAIIQISSDVAFAPLSRHRLRHEEAQIVAGGAVTNHAVLANRFTGQRRTSLPTPQAFDRLLPISTTSASPSTSTRHSAEGSISRIGSVTYRPWRWSR